ncbi:MAG: RsmE family RNA methyltransferase [Vicinamibacterales bacterium]|nr:RsmE family RNA methyltransferase [Vicinamibacterales bacterium]
MRLNRFHLPGAVSGATMLLPDDESGHATRVLRVHAGTSIRVFDGLGHEFAAVVRAAGRSGVVVEVGKGVPAPAAEPGVSVTLVMAILKGDHMDAVVRDATMLGVCAVQPVVTDRTEVTMAALSRGRRRARLERVAVSSAKQCGRAVVPEVFEPVPLPELLSRWGTEPGATRLVCVEPSASVEAVSVRDIMRPESPVATLVIGPEGGWSGPELQALAVHCRFVRLGARTLRADAAPLVALAALMTVWGDL